MSLNNIQLNPRLLTGLYPDVLVETAASTPLPEPRVIRHLGNNAQHILLVVNHPATPFLSPGELTFLTNILSACKLTLDDVAIVNIHALEKAEIEDRIADLAPKSVLLFGIGPLAIGLPINFPPSQLQSFNKRMYLYSPTFRELESDKAMKLKLWNCLKNLFGI